VVAAARSLFQLALVLVLVSWFAAMLYLGVQGYFRDAGGAFGFSAVQLAIIVPQLAFAAAYLCVRPFARLVRNADLNFLVSIQVVRILALSHLVMWGYGLMAGSFALPVALGNFLVFVLALSAVPAVAHQRRGWRFRIWLLSCIGLTEFLMTIVLSLAGAFTAPLPFDPAIADGGYRTFKLPPLSLFPTFAIPALMMVHIATLLALWHQRPPSVLALLQSWAGSSIPGPVSGTRFSVDSN